MSISFTRRGYIRLLRDGTQISQHSVAEEAYENAIAHAEANGPGRYVVKYPDRELDVGVFVTRSSIPASDASNGNPFFIDDFNYAMGRADSSASKDAAFAAAGWVGYKDQSLSTGAKGYLYTVTSIEGDSAGFPTANTRALAIEGLPATLVSQTDYYISYGSSSEAVGYYPANVWIQFWIYLQDDSGSGKLSTIPSNNKFIYPKLTGDGTQATGEFGYLGLLGSSGFQSIRLSGAPASYPTNELFLAVDTDPGSGSEGANNTNCSDPPTNKGKLYQNLNNTVKITPNQWYLVKQHFDISTANQGTWEAWIAAEGGAFTKVAEWIGGVTSGFTWPTPTTTRSGFRAMAMPTTENYSGAVGDNYKYLQDFAMATSESDLPTYAGTG